MDTWKTSYGTLCHILASGSAAAGQFALNVQEPLKCYRPNVRKVTPGIHALHHLVNHNFQHTYPRSTCKYWWHSGAPGVIPPSERLFVGPGWSSPLDFFDRGSTHVLFHRFRFV